METCEVCLRPKDDGQRTDDCCSREWYCLEDDGGHRCLRLGYEREKARADTAEASDRETVAMYHRSRDREALLVKQLSEAEARADKAEANCRVMGASGAMDTLTELSEQATSLREALAKAEQERDAALVLALLYGLSALLWREPKDGGHEK